MTVTDTEELNIDRRRFFHLAAGGASLAACVAGALAVGLNRRGVLGVAAGGAGIAALAATGTALAEEEVRFVEPQAVGPATSPPLTGPVQTHAVRSAAPRTSGLLSAQRVSIVDGFVPTEPCPDPLQRAAALLNEGRRITILCGRGAVNAREEIGRLADVLGAPVVKTSGGTHPLPLQWSRFDVISIGEIGTAPSNWVMAHCDTLLILGSNSPWLQYYPAPGQARAIQVDIKSDRLGARYPVAAGLAGDIQATIRRLLPLLTRQDDRGFLREAARRAVAWDRLLADTEAHSRAPDGSRGMLAPLHEAPVLRLIEKAAPRRIDA